MDGDLNAFDIIRQIAEKVAPGRPPAYSEAHVLMALELIGAGLGIGRQQLSRELRLGEGTVRTLASRMKGLGLVDASRGGMTLTAKGNEVLKELKDLIMATEFPGTPMTVGSQNYAILVKGAAGNVRRGVEQRDIALIAGAKGATTLLYDGDNFHMPGVDMVLDPSITQFLFDNLKPEAGDVVIIGTADDLFAAEMGAKTAALKLLREMEDHPD